MFLYQLLQLFSRILQLCFTATLQKCFADCETLYQREGRRWSVGLDFWVNCSFNIWPRINDEKRTFRFNFVMCILALLQAALTEICIHQWDYFSLRQLNNQRCLRSPVCCNPTLSGWNTKLNVAALWFTSLRSDFNQTAWLLLTMSQWGVWRLER